jgi:Flp pilus assembly protein TadD
MTRIVTALLLAAVLVHVPARAEEPDPAQLANQAVVLSEQGRTAEAVALYRQALALAAGPVRSQILINLGKAYGSLEQWPEAWEYLSLAVA